MRALPLPNELLECEGYNEYCAAGNEDTNDGLENEKEKEREKQQTQYPIV